jgi:hypothetical protein
MMMRNVNRVMTAAVLAGGVALLVPSVARAQGHHSTGPLPEKEGKATVVGCFLSETIKDKPEYVLTKVMMGPATTTTEATCSATSIELKPNGQGIPLRLTDVKDLRPSMESYVGRWVEITGILRKPRDGDDMRQMHVDSYKLVPVVVPRVSRAMPAPAPYVAPAPAPEPAPAPTSGVTEELPKTASPLPLIGFIGLLAFAGGFVLRQFRVVRG